ncbi:MAG: chemotaxis protein CheD [Betaproteobacteria bacterium]|nr:chemotaxis protein CheD [Betaproteobacteria bacterium]
MKKGAPEDIIEIFLQPGEFYFGEEKTRIRTLLGSCVAITLWHPKQHIGGMSHYMLPQRPQRRPSEALDGRYADEVMQLFHRELQRTRTRPAEYQVKIFGGGHMFDHVQKNKRHTDISDRNIEVGRQLVAQYGYRLSAEDLGGNGHRNVILDLWSGDVWMKRAERAAPAVAG